MGARHVEELEVWQMADQLRRLVYELSALPVVKADVRYCSQLRDAAGSVPRNIAEGFGRFRPREFAQYVFVARGSVHELRDLIIDGEARGYWSASSVAHLDTLCVRVSAALSSLGQYLRGDGASRFGRQ